MSQDTIYELISVTDTVDGEGAVVDTNGKASEISADCRFFLDVTAASGTSPTLDVNITTVINGVDHVVASFTQQIVVGQENIFVPQCPADVKVEYAIGGTAPSFTFTVHSLRI